ncbi:MAG: hypothetical protein IKX11_05970, partial [Bacteroidales bacterium]|nr:hypothetical protein [Bacteroidales bacterium]
MKRFLIAAIVMVAAVACTSPGDFDLQAGQSVPMTGSYTDFTLTGQALLEDGADASVYFHTDGNCARGYQVLLHN